MLEIEAARALRERARLLDKGKELLFVKRDDLQAVLARLDVLEAENVELKNRIEMLEFAGGES